MKQHRSILALCTAVAVSAALMAPAAALFGWGNSDGEETPTVSAFSKNGLATQNITFSPEDFALHSAGKLTLDAIVITALPEEEAGILAMGNTPLSVGDSISASALSGLRFMPAGIEGEQHTAFAFAPQFSDGQSGGSVPVDLYLLTEENNAPIAENIQFTTYKDVAYTGIFAAVDPEGDLLTFQLVDKPARGAVTLSEDGTGTFVYTPYEGKTGKDSFTYVAVDAVGNRSGEAKVTLRIEKPSTTVTYADMKGHPACSAAIRLAEEKLLVGQQVSGQYFFQPDAPVSRSEFLSLAMNVAGVEPMENITTTGFFDDSAIPVWAKGYAASALKAGVIQGQVSETGDIVFNADSQITRAEAAVILNQVLAVSDAAAVGSYADGDTAPAWAYQAAVNLETVGVLSTDSAGALALEDTVDRAEAAQMLCAAMDVLEARRDKGWFS